MSTARSGSSSKVFRRVSHWLSVIWAQTVLTGKQLITDIPYDQQELRLQFAAAASVSRSQKHTQAINVLGFTHVGTCRMHQAMLLLQLMQQHNSSNTLRCTSQFPPLLVVVVRACLMSFNVVFLQWSLVWSPSTFGVVSLCRQLHQAFSCISVT